MNVFTYLLTYTNPEPSADRRSVLLEPGLGPRRGGGRRHRLAQRRRVVVVALGLEEDGRRRAHSRPPPVGHFAPEVSDRVTAVAAARTQTQPTHAALRRTRPVCSSNTHTHPFNGPFSGTTQVSRYQKGKTNLDFTEARDSEWQWHQLGHMQVCTLLQTDNHATTPPLSFLQAGYSSCRPTNSVKALKALQQ